MFFTVEDGCYLLWTGISECAHSTVKTTHYHKHFSKMFTKGETSMFSKSSLSECLLTLTALKPSPTYPYFFMQKYLQSKTKDPWTISEICPKLQIRKSIVVNLFFLLALIQTSNIVLLSFLILWRSFYSPEFHSIKITFYYCIVYDAKRSVLGSLIYVTCS